MIIYYLFIKKIQDIALKFTLIKFLFNLFDKILNIF